MEWKKLFITNNQKPCIILIPVEFPVFDTKGSFDKITTINNKETKSRVTITFHC